jgi:hypothetical protein
VIRILLAAAAAALLASGEVRVDASCPWEDKDGYTPVLVRVEALVRPLQVDLEVVLGEASARDRVAVEPGRPLVRTVLVPSNSGYGQPRVRWDAGSSAGEDGASPAIDYRTADLVLLDPAERVALPELVKAIADRIGSGGGSGRGGWRSSSTERARRIAVDLLPDRWQGWPVWLSLLTTAEGERLLSPAQREAIAAWTRVGGGLYTTDPQAVETWRRLGARVALASDPITDSGLFERLKRAAEDPPAPRKVDVPGTDELPTGWFLTLAIAFAIVAGPLNLWWVKRRGKPWLLLVSTPIISAGTCALLIAVTLIADGVGRTRIAGQIAILDPAAQRVATFTAATYFCGIAPGSFALDPDDRLVPMDPSDWEGRWRRDAPDLAIDWRGGQTAGPGWISARVNRQIAVTQWRPERRRLAITRTPGGWSLVNGLDVAISEANWIDPSGTAWGVGAVASGAEAPLARLPRAASWPDALVARLGPDLRLALPGQRKPGTLAARLASPLLPLPGPPADDATPPEAWVLAHLTPPGEERF